MSRRNKDKGRLAQFTPMLHGTMDSRAWRTLSHGAARLYVSLKRRVPKGRNVAYLSYRQAEIELGASPRKIAEWFRELVYYGFIVLHSHGSLGVDGKGKSPHWRLTELGTTRAASADDSRGDPTLDFLQWNGVPFERTRRVVNPDYRKKQNPASHVVHIEKRRTVTPVVHITSITTTGTELARRDAIAPCEQRSRADQ